MVHCCFQKNPLQILTGDQYRKGVAHVFPIGTKVAQRMDGILAIIGMGGAGNPSDWSAPSYAKDAYEITLTQTMSWDNVGVSISGSNAGRGLATVVVSNETASKPSFDVKFSLGGLRNEYGSLLFSETPVKTIGARPYNYAYGAYVFPLGTKIAYTLDGAFVSLFAAEATPWLNGDWVLHPVGAKAQELVLTEEMGKDENGVLITAPRTSSDGTFDSPIVRVVPADTPANVDSEEVQRVYQWNLDIAKSPGANDGAMLKHYRQPSPLIMSDHPDIIALASSITEGKSSDYDKTAAIHAWVACNIWYDQDVYEGKVPNVAKTVLDTLAEQRGVCGDYANLTIALLRASGIPARRVTGLVRYADKPEADNLFYALYKTPADFMAAISGSTDAEALYYHGWNEAYVDGKWMIMDTTWDSYNHYKNGVYSEQARGIWFSYFDISMEKFSRDHRYAGFSDEITPEFGTDEVTPVLDDRLETADGWAKDGIRSATAKGFVPTDLQSDYTAIITRQEFCRMAVKFVEYHTGKSIDAVLAERGLSRNTSAFSDTDNGDILTAHALGITNGTSASTFSPGGQFKREQAAAMLMSTCNIIGMETGNAQASGLADADSVAPWAVAGVNFCWDKGVMNGTGGNKFSPQGTYTRQEAIVTFDRIK